LLSVLFFLQSISIKAASPVEPLGFSGCLPIMFLCYILCNTFQANKDVFLQSIHRPQANSVGSYYCVVYT